MKKLLTYCGILVSFVFLLVINTNALSGKGCNEFNCLDRRDCYYDSSHGDPVGYCGVLIPPPGRRCSGFPSYERPCVQLYSKMCCDLDYPVCHVVKYDEGEGELEMSFGYDR